MFKIPLSNEAFMISSFQSIYTITSEIAWYMDSTVFFYLFIFLGWVLVAKVTDLFLC